MSFEKYLILVKYTYKAKFRSKSVTAKVIFYP